MSQKSKTEQEEVKKPVISREAQKEVKPKYRNLIDFLINLDLTPEQAIVEFEEMFPEAKKCRRK